MLAVKTSKYGAVLSEYGLVLSDDGAVPRDYEAVLGEYGAVQKVSGGPKTGSDAVVPGHALRERKDGSAIARDGHVHPRNEARIGPCVACSDVCIPAPDHDDDRRRHWIDEEAAKSPAKRLSLVLLERTGPFIADQPEDNLANRYVAEHLCPVFSEVQSNGQFIVVTHNASLPILGRARRGIELQADGKRGWVEGLGTPRPMENVLGAGARPS